MMRSNTSRSALLSLTALLATGVAVGSASAQSIPVRLGGEASSLLGVEFNLPIEIDMTARSEKVGSAALTVRWNPAVVRFIGGSNGNLGDVQVNEDSLPAGVFKMVSVSPAGTGGRVTIGVVRLKPLLADTTTFRLQVTELYAAVTFADLLPSVVASNRAYCPAVGRFADIDGDGLAGSRDALLALSHAVGKDITGFGNPALGDVDGDGVTGARDALVILSAAVGLNVTGFRVLRVAPGACATGRRPGLMVTPATLLLDLGQQATMVAVASDSTGAGVAATDVLWTTSNANVVTVDPNGVITAVGAGVAQIVASRLGAPGAAATVTVARRRVHLVDAFAFAGQEDRLGAPERPFATIQEAVNFARPGDTVRVGPGRYEEVVTISRPVVVEGDTSGGRPKPFIATTGTFNTSFTIDAPGRVELHRLRVDTVYNPVQIMSADTFVARDLELRASCSGGTGINVLSAGVVRVERSVLVGSGGTYGSYYYYYYDPLNCYSNNGIYASDARVLAIDSSVIADYADDGVYLENVDSLFVRGSEIRHNSGYGVYQYGYYTDRSLAMVFTRNRMTQNQYGHVYAYDYYSGDRGLRSARFDHNVYVGGGYDGITLYGDTGVTVVSFVADTFHIRDGAWLNLQDFDSLLVDSVIVNRMDDYAYIEGGRIAIVRNTKFLELTGQAMYMYAWPRDSMHLEVRNVEFRGPDSTSCDRCGRAIDFNDRVSLVMEDVVGVNLDELLYLWDGYLTARNITVQRAWEGIYAGCASTRVTSSSFTDVYYAIDGYGCDPTDSLILDSVSVSRGYYAIETDDLHVRVTNSSFQDVEYGALYHDCGSVRWIKNTITNDPMLGYGDGIYAWGCDPTDSLIVKRSTFAGQWYGALYAGYMPAVVDTNSFSDSDENIDLWGASATVRDNVIVRPRYDQGIDVDGDGVGSVVVQRNSVTCSGTSANSAISAEVNGPNPARVADNVISGCRGTGIWLYTTAGGLVEAVRNTVTLPDTSNYGIHLQGDVSGLARIDSNAVTGKARYGSIRLSSAMARVRVDANTVTGGIQAGIYAAGAIDTLAIRDNVIQNHGSGTCCVYASAAIMLDGSQANDVSASVLRNRITKTTNGIVLRRGSSGDTVPVLVDSNTVRGADSMGVWVRYYSRANVRKNAIDSSGLDGVRLEQYSGVPPALVNYNNLTRNVQRGVRNSGSAGVIDATNNWWGDAGGPRCAGGATGCTGAGDSVSANVTFSPFLVAPTDAPTPAPPLVASLSTPPSFAATSRAGPVAVQGAVRTLPVRSERPEPARVRPMTPVFQRAPAPDGVDDPMVEADRRQEEQRSAAAAARELRLQARDTERAGREAMIAEREAERQSHRAEAERRRAERRERPR